MALDPLQVKVAETVCALFTSSRRPVARKELVLLVRDGYVLDEMANRTLIRTDANRAQYFPTLGTFALLDDTDGRLIAAHEATVRILPILLRLYETRDASHMRSIKRRRSLLVEDVQPDVLANVDWQPTDVSFVDAASNDKKEFRISLTESPELSTLLLEMTT